MEPLTELDRALLAAETPAQHLHVLATLVLSPPPSLPAAERFALTRRVVQERFHLVAPMRRRLVRTGFGGLAWVDDPDVDVDQHLRHTVVDPPGDLAALARATSAIASAPLDRRRPLWELWFVDGLAGDRIAVVAKVHHAALDGVSGFFALAGFFDLTPDGEGPPPPWVPDRPPGPVDLARSAWAELLAWPARLARGVTGLARVGATVTGSLRSTTGSGAPGAAADAPRAALPLTAPRLSMNRSLSPRRAVAFRALALDDVKRVRAAVGGTVNDVLVALTAGALRRHLVRRGELPDRPLVAAIPTSERRPEHGTAGNRFSTMFYALPVHESEPLDRLRSATASAAAGKEFYERAGRGLLDTIAGLAPPVLVAPTMQTISRTRLMDRVPVICNLMVSNVRGPDVPLFVAGSRLDQLFPLGPVLEGNGLNVTVMSYRDELAIGLIGCAQGCDGIDALASDFGDELDALVTAAERP